MRLQPGHRIAATALLLAALAAGCATVSEPPRSAERGAPPAIRAPSTAPDTPMSLGQAVAELAMSMIGTPYRYGGASPEQGFDCSGLVFYAYSKAGHAVPRSSREQFKVARKIALDRASAGDVMFFQDEAQLSHVGIYVGDGMFVHAPANGRRVALASIDSPYYQRHLVAVGRLAPD